MSTPEPMSERVSLADRISAVDWGMGKTIHVYVSDLPQIIAALRLADARLVEMDVHARYMLRGEDEIRQEWLDAARHSEIMVVAYRQAAERAREAAK